MRRRYERDVFSKYVWWSLIALVLFLSIYVPSATQKSIEKTLELKQES